MDFSNCSSQSVETRKDQSRSGGFLMIIRSCKNFSPKRRTIKCLSSIKSENSPIVCVNLMSLILSLGNHTTLKYPAMHHGLLHLSPMSHPVIIGSLHLKKIQWKPSYIELKRVERVYVPAQLSFFSPLLFFYPALAKYSQESHSL